MDGGAASLSSAVSFLGMWVAMTAAMMLPSLAPALWRYRRALRDAGDMRAGRLTVVVTAAYFSIWIMVGVAVFPLAVLLERATALVVGSIVVIAAAVQLSSWKARQLATCRALSKVDHVTSASSTTAWRHGVCLARHCILSCVPPMASLLAIGMMDLRAMAVVTIAITLERLAPEKRKVAVPASPLALTVRAGGGPARWQVTRSVR